MICKRSIGLGGIEAGAKHIGAGGENIGNEGEFDFPLKSIEGHRQSMVFQIAEVNKALELVAYIVNRA